MGFISAFFRAYVDMMEDAGFIEGFIIFVLFVFLISMVYSLLFVAVVLLAVALCNLWSGAGAGAATVAQAAPEEPDAAEGPAAVEELAAAVERAVVEEPTVPPVAEVAVLPAGGEPAARVVCRRLAIRDLASDEPGSSSGGVLELEGGVGISGVPLHPC